jgi:hypothetical protein
MSAPGTNLVREALAEYAAGKADKDRVMRALVGHDGWFVPAAFATEALGEKVFERTILLGTQFDAAPDDLTIFTDPEAVLTAYGQSLGPFVGKLPGMRVFRAISDRYESVRINMASPEEERWVIARDGFPIAKLWTKAVALERLLAGAAERGFPHREMRAYAGYTVLIANADRTLVLSKLADGVSMCAIAFTAPDRAERFAATLPAETRPAIGTATLDGATLFGHLAQSNVAGLLLNSDDPAGTLFMPRAEFDAVLTA